MSKALSGFYGKVPTHGDFVTRRLPRSFLDPWDRWLQEGIATSRRQLGDAWLKAYLVSPLWRFCLSPGLCGPDVWAGILMPSVDRVGRYYPLNIATSLPEGTTPFGVPVLAQAWFDEAQATILSTLEDEGFDLEAFDERVGGLASRLPDPGAVSSPSEAPRDERAWRVPVISPTRIADVYPALLHDLTALRLGAYSLWWTEGSQYVVPSLLACAGLPPVEGYSALLDGRWQAGLWWDRSAAASAPGPVEGGNDPSS